MCKKINHTIFLAGVLNKEAERFTVVRAGYAERLLPRRRARSRRWVSGLPALGGPHSTMKSLTWGQTPPEILTPPAF